MEIIIRDTIEGDLPAIFEIRRDPLVKPHQYRLKPNETVDSWKRMLFVTPMSGDVLFKSATILRDNSIIGHITHTHYLAGPQPICYCGWNLAPAYWGQGIAVIALSQLFDSLFDEQGVGVVISDCFAENQRCIRVFHKLNYEPSTIPLDERVIKMILKLCLHRIIRYKLTADRWRSRR